MNVKYGILMAVGALSISPAFVSNTAFAGEEPTISIYEHEWDFYSDSQYKAALFESRRAEDGTPRAQLKQVEDPDLYEKEQRSKTYRFVSDKNIQDEILGKLPFGKDLKGMWNFIDGDTDIFITGLRADRGNKGLSYTMNGLPIIGSMDDIKLKFSAGDDNEIQFTTHSIPFMGRLEGFTFKATADQDDNKVFARYTVPFKYD